MSDQKKTVSVVNSIASIRHSPLKKKTVQIVSSIFNDDMLSTLKEHFDSIDDDLSGTIDKEELELLYTRLGIHPSPDQLEEMINKADKDGNGEIDFEEFIRALEGEDSTVKTVEETCQAVFPVFAQSKEFVTAQDIFEICKANKGPEQFISLEECSQMIDAIKEATEDKSVESQISYEQFKMIMEYDFSS